MSTIVKIKRSAVQGKVPLDTDLELGELAINTYDGKLFLKKSVGGANTIVDVTAAAVGGTNISTSANTSAVIVISDSGDDGVILAANSTSAGILTAEAQAISGIKTFTSNVGIGTSSPSAKLDVVGDIKINSNINLNSEATTLATTTKTQVASFAAASFRSGKLIVQAYDTFTNEVQVSELLVAHNGITASATEYGVVYTGVNPLVVYDVDILSGNVRLLAQRTTPNPTQYTVLETLLSAFDFAVGSFSWNSSNASPGPA